MSLKKAGAGMTGLCPFHKEKTSSFHVNPERQIFKCFGCGVGGDVFSFVMKLDGLTFPEALQRLAERAHIELPRSEFEAGNAPRSDKTKLYDVNKWAAELYHRCLVEHPKGKPALEYLLKRGVTMETIGQFRLGYSPDAWDTLANAAARRKIPEETMQSAGLLTSSDRSNRLYDRFRNRVMFPIYDAQERVIGFGARCLDGSEPKYLNSPETPLFSKGRTLYAIDRAKQAFRDSRRAVIVEGYMDAIVAHQYGFNWVVGVLGTALSREHVQLLRRHVDDAIILFDADNAGQSSAMRSVDAFAAEEMPVRVAVLPDGLDPDELLERSGAQAFAACLDAAVDGFAFKLERALAGLPKGDASSIAVAKVLDDVLSTLALVPNAVARMQEVKRVAARTGITEWALSERLDAIIASQQRRPVDAAQPKEEAAAAANARDAQMELLGVLLNYPAVAPIIREELTMARLENATARTLLERALALEEAGLPCSADELLARTQEEPLRAILEPMVMHEPMRVEDPGNWCRQLIGRIEARVHLDAGRKLHHKIATAPLAVDAEALQARLEAARQAQRLHGKLDIKAKP